MKKPNYSAKWKVSVFMIVMSMILSIIFPPITVYLGVGLIMSGVYGILVQWFEYWEEKRK